MHRGWLQSGNEGPIANVFSGSPEEVEKQTSSKVNTIKDKEIHTCPVMKQTRVVEQCS